MVHREGRHKRVKTKTVSKWPKSIETEESGKKKEDAPKITSNKMRDTAIMMLENAYGMKFSDKEK